MSCDGNLSNPKIKKDNILRLTLKIKLLEITWTEDRIEGWSHDFAEFSILAIQMINKLQSTANAQSGLLYKDLPTFNAAFIDFKILHYLWIWWTHMKTLEVK